MALFWSKLSHSPVRKISRFLAVVAIALSAGHLAQTMDAHKAVATADAISLPTKIVSLSASPEETGLMTKPNSLAKPLPAKHIFLPAPTTPTVVANSTPDCRPVLTALTEPGAMVALTLRAPCDGGVRVVVAHGGLTVTERVAANGRPVARLCLAAAGGADARGFAGQRH